MSVASSSSQHITVQRQLRDDWDNRESIQVISLHIKKITDFLNAFDLSCRSKLAELNENVNRLERKVEYLEARITRGETLN
jgi:uncharacterized protein